MLDLTVDMCLYVGYNKLLSTSHGLHVNCAYDNILELVFEKKKIAFWNQQVNLYK